MKVDAASAGSKAMLTSGAALPINCLKVILPYLREVDRDRLIGMLQDGLGSVNIRFRSYSYRTRMLKKFVT